VISSPGALVQTGAPSCSGFFARTCWVGSEGVI
jgi:hypothetical protein